MPGSPTRRTDKVDTIMAKKIDIEREIEEEQKRLERQKNVLINVFQRLEPKIKGEIMIKRYVELRSFDEIYYSLGFPNTSKMYYLHRRALREIPRLLDK